MFTQADAIDAVHAACLTGIEIHNSGPSLCTRFLLQYSSSSSMSKHIVIYSLEKSVRTTSYHSSYIVLFIGLLVRVGPIQDRLSSEL